MHVRAQCVTVHLPFVLRMTRGPPPVWHHSYSHQETSAGAIGSERCQDRVFEMFHNLRKQAQMLVGIWKYFVQTWWHTLTHTHFIHTMRFALTQHTPLPHHFSAITGTRIPQKWCNAQHGVARGRLTQTAVPSVIFLVQGPPELPLARAGGC